MSSKKFALQALAVAALVVSAGASQAALTVYTSSAAFAAATTAPGVDTFAGFSITGVTPSPINRSAGAYTYSASAPGGFFGAGTTLDPWLSTNLAGDSVTFNNFVGGSIQAIGANFFGSDISGLFSAGNVTLVATEVGGATSTQTITGATVSSFLGFSSSLGITSLVLSAVQASSGTGVLWPTTDNLTIATLPVPEPGTYALLLAGLATIGAVVRRRQA